MRGRIAGSASFCASTCCARASRRIPVILPDDHLRKAIEIDPREQPSRIELIKQLIEAIAFAAHHLPDYYIGDPAEALKVADQVAPLIDDVDDAELRARLSGWLAHERQLAQDWQQFRAEGGEDFAAWCGARGRRYHWVKSYYWGESNE